MENNKDLINERFTEVVTYIVSSYKKVNKKAIAEQLNISKSTLSEILKRRLNVKAELIAKICLLYKEINPDWILTKRGSMIVEDNRVDNMSFDVLLEQYKLAIEENTKLQSKIEALQEKYGIKKSVKIYPDNSEPEQSIAADPDFNTEG